VSFLTSRWFRYLVSLGLLAVVIWVADWRAIWQVLRDVDLAWVGGAAGLAAIDRLVLNYRWQLLLAARSLNLGFLQLFRIQLAANFLGSFLPSSLGVDAIRITALLRAGLPPADVFASTLVDRATIVVATLVFGSATIIALAGTRIPDDLFWLILLLTGAMVAGGVAIVQPGVRRWARERLFARLPVRVRDKVADVARATLAYRHQRRLLAWVSVTTLFVFAIRILFAKALVLACGADVGFADLLLVIPLLWIIVMLPITIGGIGLQDVGYVALMALIGVPAAVAVSMSLIEHVVSRAVCLPGAFFLSDVTGAPAPDAVKQRVAS
jgi:uncharacterized protein (TIRG00374 family)